MPRILLLLAIIIALVILVRRVQAMPPHKRRGGYLQLLFGGAAIVAILLTLAGRMHWVGAAATGLLVAARQALPLLIRAFPLLQSWFSKSGQSKNGQTSELKSALLRMSLDHETGELDGQVTAGPYQDWYLRELSTVQLRDLLRYCEQNDPDSADLLTGYLEQRFPDGFSDDDPDDEQESGQQSAEDMNRAEALAVLGLSDDADEEAIVSAHRRLMQKLHPDRGGNDYLASKINAAKDFLLDP